MSAGHATRGGRPRRVVPAAAASPRRPQSSRPPFGIDRARRRANPRPPGRRRDPGVRGRGVVRESRRARRHVQEAQERPEILQRRGAQGRGPDQTAARGGPPMSLSDRLEARDRAATLDILPPPVTTPSTAKHAAVVSEQTQSVGTTTLRDPLPAAAPRAEQRVRAASTVTAPTRPADALADTK